MIIILVYVAVTVAVFLFSYQVGKNQSIAELKPCPIIASKIIKSDAIKAITETAFDMSGLPQCPEEQEKIYNHCIESPYNSDRTFLHLAKGLIPDIVFPFLHHPGQAAMTSFVLTQEETWSNDSPIQKYCNEVYLTRSGSRANQPNKCVAVAKVPEKMASEIHNSHRIGFTAALTNQYRDDFIRQSTFKEEIPLLTPLLRYLPQILNDFKRKIGSAVNLDGSRRALIIMVANEGVMDLALNFICSAESSGIDLSTVVMFVGAESDVVLVENMGAIAVYNPALGSMPKHAAKEYLDETFSNMMWFKTTSVFLAIEAGFDVLFQDVDLVWMKDPIPYLRERTADISFMDDGARTTRYTPFFVNSGFFFVKYNERTKFFQEKMMKCSPTEIGRTHSHQSVLIKHLSELHHLVGLTVYVLEKDLFPSGEAYHDRKKYMATITDRSFTPYVFHMCWTSNRADKVTYFKEVGLWYLPEDPVCLVGELMNTHAALSTQRNKATGQKVDSGMDSMRNRCCQRNKYFKSKPIPAVQTDI